MTTFPLPAGLRGLIFDLDGTLYRMKWYMKPLLTIKLFPDFLLLPRYMEVRKKFSGRDLGDGTTLLEAMAGALTGNSNLSSSVDMIRWIDEKFYSAFVEIMPRFRRTRPGIDTCLAGLKQKGYRAAILSDFARIPERLHGLSIDSALFDPIVSSEEQGCLKPCSRPLHAITKTWKLASRQILVIGDRLDTDGIAAREAGMHFVQISDKSRPSAPTRTWKDLKESLESLPQVR